MPYGVYVRSWSCAGCVMKRTKYGNIKVVVDGIKFDSMKEANRYRQLSALEKRGDISELECQPKFKYFIGEKWIFSYSADFRFKQDGKTVIEDVKSVATKKNSTYRIKKKIIEAEFNVKISEV